MQIQYDQVQAANLAPYLELMQKQQQQPMMDALNRQKLQEGMLSMGSLEYAQRKKMEDDAQSRDAALMLQQSMLPNKDNTGLELDQAKTFKAMLEKGINPKVAAEAMGYAGTGTGATSADKQANAIELLNQKLQSAKELADEKASGQEAKLNLNQYDKLIESTAGLVGNDWFGDPQGKAKAELASAIASAGKDPKKIADIFAAFKSSTEPGFAYLPDLVDNTDFDPNKFKTKLADILSVPKKSNK